MTAGREARIADGIAVVGMAGRFPGARTVDQLWRNLLDRVESITSFTPDELRAAGEDAQLIDDPDYVPARGILEASACFDEQFFGYSVREAQLLDPQQRLFLECAWHALERAGFDPARHAGAAGVFASTGMSSYLLELAADPRVRVQIGMFELSLHNAPDYLATRVSYKAGLTGPAFTVQTGCSSSLVAIHLACQSLLSGECDLALAGGVTARAPQRRGYLHDPGSALSADGHCRPFDALASGTVPSEAVAVVALKRVEDALRDRNHIHAIVAGSAINNDGDRKVGYTAPSVDGQCNAIAEALEVAGVSPRSVGYVEAHGTGTRLGDPLEVAALTRAFRAATSDRQYCLLGSIKSNIGHADAAAGVAGFMKAVLTVEHGVVPPTVHYTAPNPEIDFAHSPFLVNREAAPWPARGPVRCAGVSAFGIGGTNAHAVIVQAPAPPERERAARVQVPARPQLILLSARTEAALDRVSDELCRQLETAPAGSEPALDDLAFTSQSGRKAFEHRRAVVASRVADVAAALRSRDPMAVRTGERRPRSIAFLFPGGGTQYPNMGRGLYEAELVFRDHIDRCCELTQAQIGADLRPILYPDPADVERAGRQLQQVRYGVPAVWMTSYALAQLLLAWGLTPRCMIGHSLGEYVAACVSGVLSMRDALTLATSRALLFERATDERRGGRGERADRGASSSVSLGEAELRPLLPARVDIGVVNTPSSCVASGPERAVAELEQVLAARGVQFKRLQIGAAVHSSLMDPLLDEVRQIASRMAIGEPRIPYYSNLFGRLIEPADLTPDYWAQHLRRTVRFADNVRGMLQQPGLAVLEVGPGTSLCAAVSAQVTPAMDVVALSAMRHPRDPREDREVLAQCVGAAWSHGVDVDWSAARGGRAARLAPFPVYSFEPTPHWVSAEPPPAGAASEAAPATSRPAQRRVQLAAAYRDDELAQATAEIWADQLGVAALTPESNFFSLGGTSLIAVRLLAKLQRRLHAERRLLPEELLQAPGFGAFVEHLRATARVEPSLREPGGEGDGDALSSLVLLKEGRATDRAPLVIVHPAGGHLFHYRLLVEALEPRVSVYGLKAPGVDGERAPLQSVEELAEHHLRSLRTAGFTKGPYHLAGSSFGGCVAYEMALRLREAGDEVALLAMIDTPSPDDLPRFEDHVDYVDYLFGDMWKVELSRRELRALPEPARIPYALQQLTAAGVELGFDADTVERILKIFMTSGDAMRSYRPRPYTGPVVYFRARERRGRDPERPERGWTRYASGGLHLEDVPGNHVTMHELPHVTELASRLNAHLAASLLLPAA